VQLSSEQGSVLEALVQSYQAQLTQLAAQLRMEQRYSRGLKIQLQELHGELRMGDAMIATLCTSSCTTVKEDEGQSYQTDDEP
jgi:hypothetical protein